MLAERLTEPERTELVGLEGTIQRNLQAFVDAGTALYRIREGRLYREQAETFKEYCESRWKLTPQRAGQLISAADAVRSLVDARTEAEGGSQNGKHAFHFSPETESSMPLPDSVRQAEELAKAPAQERPETWDEAVKTAPKNKQTGKPKVTAKHVKAVVKRKKSETAQPTDAAAEDAAPAEPPIDPAGNLIPSAALAAVFAEAAEHHGAALNLLTQLAGRVNPVIGDAKDKPPLPSGYHTCTQRQQILTDLRNLRTALTQTRPHSVCPYCRAAGKYKGAKCAACHGLGWVVKGTYDGAPADMREDLKRLKASPEKAA